MDVGISHHQLRRIAGAHQSQWNGVDHVCIEARQLGMLLQEQLAMRREPLGRVRDLADFLQIVDDEYDVRIAGFFLD